MDDHYAPRTRHDQLRESDLALQQVLEDAAALGLVPEPEQGGSRIIGLVEGFECRLIVGAPRLGPREPQRLPVVEGSMVRFFPEHVLASPVELGEWAIKELGLSAAQAARFATELQRQETVWMRRCVHGIQRR